MILTFMDSRKLSFFPRETTPEVIADTMILESIGIIIYNYKKISKVHLGLPLFTLSAMHLSLDGDLLQKDLDRMAKFSKTASHHPDRFLLKLFHFE